MTPSCGKCKWWHSIHLAVALGTKEVGSCTNKSSMKYGEGMYDNETCEKFTPTPKDKENT